MGKGDTAHLEEDRIRFFWEKVKKLNDLDACWLWTGHLNKRGYGRFSPAIGKYTGAHRYSWILHNGPIPNGLCVCHNCPDGDNPACVNPRHLWLGTYKQNTQDMLRKGRHAHGETHYSKVKPELVLRGERNGATILTEEQIHEIRRIYSLGKHTQKALSVLFETEESTIGKLLRGKNWGWMKEYDDQGEEVPYKRAPRLSQKAGDHPRAKFTNEQVREIRRLFDTGEFTRKEIQEKYRVERHTIYKIISGKTYPNI